MSQEAPPLRLELFGRTDVGQIREHNEDNFIVANLTSQIRGLGQDMRLVIPGESGLVVGVCDGMGGAAAGEVASQLAVDIIYQQLLESGAAKTRDDLARRLVDAIEYAGAQIFQEARADRSRRGMGTTATVAAFLDRRVFIGQVGDSRAYLLRQGKLVQLTRDQSLVNQLIEAGQLTEEEAETFEHNNIILQALGTAETVQVDLTYVDLCQDDVLMLCSDGLSGMIRNDEIAEVLSTAPSPLEACKELTERANAAGGHDNITVIVMKVIEGAPRALESEKAAYQKYAIVDVNEVEEDAPSQARLFDTIKTNRAEIEAEVERQAQNLRVAHTVIGAASPLEAIRAAEKEKAARSAAPNPGKGSFPPKRDERERSGRPSGFDEPVLLPTHTFPPLLMGTIVLSALVLAGLLGYLAIR
jgi:PPM family protein phosphatase